MNKLAILVSGTGSLLQAFIDKQVPTELVFADRRCQALEISRAAGIKTGLVERTDFTQTFNRDLYTDKVMSVLKENKIDIIAMAGFMTVFSPAIFDVYGGRIFNTHPSLLPRFKGANAVRDALEEGTDKTGCTVHHATSELDEGPILSQVEVPILLGDTVESLHERIKIEERNIYPKLILKFITNT